jgi:hypothetical protein
VLGLKETPAARTTIKKQTEQVRRPAHDLNTMSGNHCFDEKGHASQGREASYYDLSPLGA